MSFFVLYPFSFLNHHLHLTGGEKERKKTGQVGCLAVEMQYLGVKLSRTAYLQDCVRGSDQA